MAVPISSEGPLTHDERRHIVSAVINWQARHACTQREIAKQLPTMRENTLCEILKGVYEKKVSPETYDKHLRTLNNWMEVDARRRQGDEPGKPLTNTRVVRMVKTAVNHCRKLATMGYVTGPAGAGKTVTIKTIMDTEPGIYYYLVNGDRLTPNRMIHAIAESFELGRRNRSHLLRGVTFFERVRQHLAGSHFLLVFDDAHKLKITTLELIREIHDACDVPVLMLGEYKLAEKIRDTTNEDAGQLESRFGIKLDIRRDLMMKPDGTAKQDAGPLFTKAQIREIIAGPGLRFDDAAVDYLLTRIANVWGMGGIRSVKFLIALAVRYARKRSNTPDGKPVTVTLNDLYAVARERDKTLLDGAPPLREAASA